MALNRGKYHFSLISNHGEPDKINLNGMEIISSNNEKLLSVFIDKKLSFDVLIKSQCKNAGPNLSAFAKIGCYRTLDQKLLLINSLIKSQSSYFPLKWMFCSRSLTNSLNHIHERAPTLICDDTGKSFQDILEMTNEKLYIKKNLECFAQEICKILHGLVPPIMKDVVKIKK